MTQDEIIEMANKVGCKSYSPPPTRSVAGVSMTFAQVEELIKLVSAKEREACAKLCEEYRDEWFKGLGRYEFMAEGADYLADFIRARGEA